MTRDTTEQPAARPTTSTSAPAKKPAGNPAGKPAGMPAGKPAGAPSSKPAGAPAGKPGLPPVPRPAPGSSRDLSTPADGTPAVKPATGAGAPPTISPASARSATSTGARPPERKPAAGPRRVRLAVSRVDPWSVMKLAFLLSIGIGIMIVVASVVFWLVLDGLHVFTEVNDMVVTILGEDATQTDILQYVELQRFVSLATIIAIVDVVLLTALSTIGAFLYNVVAALVGGVHLTLTDE
ncbi:DUF3566 domain-containing protein [Sanguibacter antarcticus]|uniref:Transmembrane protein DUF3566 n=1 Tax=Sanguibacter antarcticus TaxID=372484 RepID=A0A2A9E7B0_9MICO|nr:DUF3566 domain-containing protein [Sanguibacter antarcticus]PFG34744.1 transmembrane protein DUF3566 [Sanguibacter antarcticus]